MVVVEVVGEEQGTDTGAHALPLYDGCEHEQPSAYTVQPNDVKYHNPTDGIHQNVHDPPHVGGTIVVVVVETHPVVVVLQYGSTDALGHGQGQ